MSAAIIPRSLVWATNIDVLPLDHVVVRREGYLVVRSPSNPMHYWGNLLLFDEPPRPDDGSRWERLFEREFAGEPRTRHRTFAWDRADGALGAALEEFVGRGYDLEQTVGLIALREQIRPHRRANREVVVRALDPAGDAELWDAVVEVQVASRDERESEDEHREFSRTRQGDLRQLFELGRGAWFVALDPDSGQVAGSCGVVVTGTRGRFQAVDTAARYRRRGICSRLLVEAAHRSAARYGAERFVIAADPGYHALGLYESLGFARAERVCGACRRPR